MFSKTLTGILAMFLVAFLVMSFISQEDSQSIYEHQTTLTEIDLESPPCGCPPNWYEEPEHPYGKAWDKNGDGLICFKILEGEGHGNDKDEWHGIVHKDNFPCGE